MRDGTRSGAAPVHGRSVPNGDRAAVVALLMIANASPLHAGDQLLVQRYEAD